MKIQSLLAVALLAISAGVTGSASAMQANPAASSDAQSEKAPAKNVKPHSHLQEKTGIAPKTAKPTEEAEKAATEPVDKTEKKERLRADKDKSRHYHPRDAK